MKHKDGSFRLRNWDYSDCGIYFVAISTKERIHFLVELKTELCF